MTYDPASYPADVTPAVVVADTPCRKCQYNLRTLPTESRCPECGTPVGFSLQGDLIRYSAPDWVDALRRGITMIVVAAVAGCLVFVYFAAAVQHARAGQSWTPVLIVLFVMWVFHIAGAWLLTTRDPSGIGEDKYGTSRRMIRFTQLAGIGSLIIIFVKRMVLLPQELNMPLGITALVLIVVALAGNLAIMQFLSKLAMRLPDIRLSNRARRVMWGWGISVGAFLGFVVDVMVEQHNNPRARADTSGGFGCCIALDFVALIIFEIMYLLLLDKTRVRLREQSALARQTWAAHDIGSG